MTVMILPFAENYLLTMQLNNIPFFSLEVRKARNGWQSVVQQVWFFCSHTLKDLSNSEVRLPNAEKTDFDEQTELASMGL